MKGTLTQDGVTADATPQEIERAAAGGAFFWLNLDIHDPGPDDDVTGLLINTFHFHPVAVEAVKRFGQRARIDDYDDFVHIITFGMAADGQGVAEVHCFVTGKFIISLHQGDCPALATVCDRLGGHHSAKASAPQVVIFYLIMDTLIDSFFPVLSDFDDSIDDLEGAILKNPTEEQLGTLFSMKRQIVTIRKVITPQRDMIASLNDSRVKIPGMTDEGSVYFRNLYDHLIRISDMVDAYRDLVGGAMDTHLSMVSNRLNVIMKQLAMIATIFLPLGFLTGFFGQNFGWLTNHLQTGFGYFLFFGIGAEIVAIVLLVILFKRRGWLGSGPTALGGQTPRVRRRSHCGQRWRSATSFPGQPGDPNWAFCTPRARSAGAMADRDRIGNVRTPCQAGQSRSVTAAVKAASDRQGHFVAGLVRLTIPGRGQ